MRTSRCIVRALICATLTRVRLQSTQEVHEAAPSAGPNVAASATAQAAAAEATSQVTPIAASTVPPTPTKEEAAPTASKAVPEPASAPATPSPTVRNFLRASLATETAALRVCEWQLWWGSPLSKSSTAVRQMAEKGRGHQKLMKDMSDKYLAAPTVLEPLVSIGAFAMGTASALLGDVGVACCHDAMQSFVAEHYNAQLRDLTNKNPLESAGSASTSKPDVLEEELLGAVSQLRNDKIASRDLLLTEKLIPEPPTTLCHLVKSVVRGASSIGLELTSRL